MMSNVSNETILRSVLLLLLLMVFDCREQVKKKTQMNHLKARERENPSILFFSLSLFFFIDVVLSFSAWLWADRFH